MAQDDGAASCALFVEQAEAAVADSTVTTHAARASRRVPGMRRARNMTGPALRRVSSTCYEAVQEFPFEIHKSLPSNGLRISSLIKVVSLLARTYGKKRRILGQPPSFSYGVADRLLPSGVVGSASVFSGGGSRVPQPCGSPAAPADRWASPGPPGARHGPPARCPGATSSDFASYG